MSRISPENKGFQGVLARRRKATSKLNVTGSSPVTRFEYEDGLCLNTQMAAMQIAM